MRKTSEGTQLVRMASEIMSAVPATLSLKGSLGILMELSGGQFDM